MLYGNTLRLLRRTRERFTLGSDIRITAVIRK